MKTSCTISFGQNALIIRGDAVYGLTTGALQPFADFNDIINDITATKPYATYEPNYWLLDGNYKFKPDTSPHVGIMGNTLSTSPNGHFATLIDFVIDFDADRSTNGLSFVFSYADDWMDVITIKFYDSSFDEIQSNMYNPTGTIFSTNQAVSNFRRIHIHLNSTNKVFRYPRIARLDFDTRTRFTGQEIKTARLVEQINPLSIELPINTLEFSLFSATGGFSIVDPSGFYAKLKNKEPLDVHESVGGEVIYMGRFYLDERESVSENEATFKASCAIGVLEEIPYNGIMIHDEYGTEPYDEPFPPSTNELLDEISNESGINYEDIVGGFGIEHFGKIDASNLRNALQQVCFSAGAQVSTARSRFIVLLPFKLASSLTNYDFVLTDKEKGITSSLVLKPLVTGVEVMGHSHKLDTLTPTITLFKAILPAGEHEVVFKEPVHSVATTTVPAFVFTQLIFRYSWERFELSADATVTQQGKTFTESNVIGSLYNDSLPAGTKDNIIRITDATLIYPETWIPPSGPTYLSIIPTVVQRVYDYYQQRYVLKTKLFATSLAPGDSVLVDVQSGKKLKGIVERMETDLANGFISDVEIVGVVI